MWKHLIFLQRQTQAAERLDVSVGAVRSSGKACPGGRHGRGVPAGEAKPLAGTPIARAVPVDWLQCVRQSDEGQMT